MKKLSFLIVILLSAQWLSAQTNVIHMRNFTDCDVICGIELFDDNHPTCTTTLVLATPITINAGTQVDLTAAQLDAIGYSSVTPPYSLVCCNMVP